MLWIRLFEIWVMRSWSSYGFHVVWEDNFKMVLQEMGPQVVGWLYLAQDRDQ